MSEDGAVADDGERWQPAAQPLGKCAPGRPAAAFEDTGQRQLLSGDAESLPHQDGELIEQPREVEPETPMKDYAVSLTVQ